MVSSNTGALAIKARGYDFEIHPMHKTVFKDSDSDFMFGVLRLDWYKSY